jgi:hypothetical protein
MHVFLVYLVCTFLVLDPWHTSFASLNAHPQITLLASLHPIAALTLPRLAFMGLGFTSTMNVFPGLLDMGTWFYWLGWMGSIHILICSIPVPVLRMIPAERIDGYVGSYE